MSSKRYIKAVTFGRFNIGHTGHTDLIIGMLNQATEAHVYVSTGKSNNDWDCRVLLLKLLLRKADVDLKRVKFLKSNSPYAAVEDATADAPRGSVVLMLGTDQQKLLTALGNKFECGTLLNPRINSSTQVRYLVDDVRFENTLNKLYYNDYFLITTVKVLRKQELQREESLEASTETREVVGGNASVEHHATS